MPVGGDDDDGHSDQDLEDLLTVEAAANIGKCPVPGCPWHKKEGTESMRANAATSHLSSTQDYIHEDFREYGAAPAAVATDDRWDGWLKGQPPVVQQAAIKFRADCERARSDDREMLNLQVEWFRLNKNQALGAPTQEIKHKRLKNVELIKALRARQKGEAVPEPEPLLEESATHGFLSSHSDAAASAGGVGRPLPPEIAGDDLGDDGDNDDADVDAAVNGQVRDDGDDDDADFDESQPDDDGNPVGAGLDFGTAVACESRARNPSPITSFIDLCMSSLR